MIKVFLVDDQQLVRTGVRSILASETDIDVIGEASSGEAALDVFRTECPDVVLMDVNMPGMGGLEATWQVSKRFPEVRIIALSVQASEPFPAQLMQAGAHGYISKDCESSELVGAIHKVVRGEHYMAANVAQNLVNNQHNGSAESPFDALSRRELEIVMLVAEGMSGQAIADQLCLSPKTISTYRYRVYEKLGVDNDVELTRLALRYGIIGE